jgi:hypothetical protein
MRALRAPAMTRALVGCLGFGLCAQPLGAGATERTVDARGRPARWLEPTVTLRLADHDGVEEERMRAADQAARSAAISWSSACSRAVIRVGEPARGYFGAVRDGVNTVTFLATSWCRAGRRANGCYPRAEMAVTTVYFNSCSPANREASLAEVDVEINAVDYDWFGDDPGKRPPPVELMTLLAHELGHALGLGHAQPNRAGWRGPGAHPSSTIMTTAAHQGAEPAVKTPSPADRKSLCAIYPR